MIDMEQQIRWDNETLLAIASFDGVKSDFIQHVNQVLEDGFEIGSVQELITEMKNYGTDIVAYLMRERDTEFTDALEQRLSLVNLVVLTARRLL